MLGSILSKIGGNIGKYLGGGILSTIGRYAGRMAGNYLEHQALKQTLATHKFTNMKDSFYIQTAIYGAPIPMIFGKMRIEGQIIWIDDIVEKRNNSVNVQHFKSKHLTLEKHVTELEHYANFAMALCEGEITEISRVWFDNKTINLGQYNFRLYKGGEEQLPDPLIKDASDGHAPAYRGMAYIVFEELPLADFNDVIPNLSFEIIRKSKISQNSSVEDLVKSITMIPGSGEYIYDTIIQKKSKTLPSGAPMYINPINSHNHYNITDSVHSLNQLQTTCQNVEWVAPVVCWFANSLEAGECEIKPAVEFKADNVTYTEEWLVGGYNRQTAHEITKDPFGNPVYGGSVNDASIVRYLKEMRSRNLKIMFYPMFFLDVPKKPWRGHITTESQNVHEFFCKKYGYNEFILHYANLVKDHVDAFVIGSELIGLTKIHDEFYNFPAVNELIELAAKVKEIVGPEVLVTYAADWSEYHHTEGGWYNLDPLWASENIDFVGIDAYFPATNSKSSIITTEELKNGWNSGEGFDYYIDQDGTKHDLPPAYAWKNVGYWWKNTHTNPNGQTTAWVPRSKPIWFTEFGFPSIDKAPNQPNVFFDPKCIDGDIPKYSNGSTDFSIQRRSIRAFIEYWQEQEYIDQMFLWTWDARPYPAWPHMDIWKDGNLWEKGHWVNNKFGTSSLASILLEISYKCGIDINNIDTSSVDEMIEGFALNHPITAINAINTLRASHFFDICANNGAKISFEKRGAKQESIIDSKSCLKISDNNFIEEIDIPKESTLNSVNLHFIDQHKDYKSSYVYINNEQTSYLGTALIRFPITLTESEAKNIGNIMLKNAATEDKIIKFTLNNIYGSHINPTDLITLEHFDKKYSIRVIEVQINKNKITITGLVDNKYNYYNATNTYSQQNLKPDNNFEGGLVVLDLPISIQNAATPFLAAYLRYPSSTNLLARIDSSIGNNYSRLATLTPSYSIGTIVELNTNPNANIFMVDNISKILIRGYNFEQYLSDDWQLAMLGKELIQFKALKKIGDQLYEISHLIRGDNGTENFIHNHQTGEDFVIIQRGANIIPVSKSLTDQKIDFKAANLETSITYKNQAEVPTQQYITINEVMDHELLLDWIARVKNHDGWSTNINTEDLEFTVIIQDQGKTHKYKTKQDHIIIDAIMINLSADYEVTIINNIQ